MKSNQTKGGLTSIESTKKLNETYLEWFENLQSSIDPSRKNSQTKQKDKKEIRNIRQKLENTEEFLHKKKQFSLRRILCQQNQNYEDLVVSDLGLETAANSEGIISKQ